MLQRSYLLHYARLALGEGRVATQLIVDVFHFDFDTSLCLFAVGRRRLLVGQRVVVVYAVVDGSAGHVVQSLRVSPPDERW